MGLRLSGKIPDFWYRESPMPAPAVPLTQNSERTGIENNWFALTGRVVAVKVEHDGDLHLALADATGNRPAIVVVEVPAKPQWCTIREKVFSFTATRSQARSMIYKEKG